MSKRTAAIRPRFAVLVVALTLLFVGTAFLDYTSTYFHPALLSGLSTVLLGFALITAVMNVSTDRGGWMVAVIRILIGATILSHVVSTQLLRPGLHVVPRLLALLCFGYAILIVMGFLMRVRRVDSDVINAAICVFLLMGISWTLWYGLISTLEPDAFSVPRAELRSGPGVGYLPVDMLYFSMVTLTTLGYGDITPMTTAARISAALEAVVGQVYLIILVARLVGLSVSQEMPQKAPGRRESRVLDSPGATDER